VSVRDKDAVDATTGGLGSNLKKEREEERGSEE